MASPRRRLAALGAALRSTAAKTSASAPSASASGGSATGTERFSLAGHVALITAGSGDLFGSSISEALAEAGATVLTASRSLARNQAYAAAMRARGYDAHGYAVDITDPASIAALRDSVLRDHGPSTLLLSSDSSQFPSACSSLPLMFWCSNTTCLKAPANIREQHTESAFNTAH